MSKDVAVFFYGLFMDESVLASRGISPSRMTMAYLDDFGLRIGKRATLIPEQNSRAYGVVMTLCATELKELYSDSSVADYVAESVSVRLADDKLEQAVCYNLPESKLEGSNPEYASSLLKLAVKLGLPSAYIGQIKLQGGGS
ncbi:MAG: gamma-glutamylcyclotransferase family protein [Pseudomonadota bacterium]